MRQKCSENKQCRLQVFGVIVVGILLLSGCSSKGVYENLQHNSRLACERQPPAAYDECLKQTGQDYESYSRERERLLKKREP